MIPPPMGTPTESEWRTRKGRIDPKLDAAGWRLPKGGKRSTKPFRSEEEPTANGPADYALWLDQRIVGVVEAKKLTVGPQNVLTQAERYARGIPESSYDFHGHRCPFLYATNGEVFWFHDVRHPLNRSRKVAAFHTPSALLEMLERDFDGACEKLHSLANDTEHLRPYQKAANAAVEKAIAERKRNLLVAMATGTGKTRSLVNQIYRLIKAGVAKRVLFLVDRRALAAQAVRAFSSFEAEPGQKFDQIYEVYSSKFQSEDFGEEEKFDPKLLPQKYLTDPKPGQAFVYVATIQRMAINILGRQAIFGAGNEEIEEDAGELDIPIHAFDLIVADECHRGYTSQEVSVWRSTLDHFDAIKVGLTATPASHTTAYFNHKVFEYGYEQAVREGYLVDYDVVKVRSNVRMNGVFLKEGENVEYVDPETGLSRMDQLEDERPFDASEIESKVTAPESNRKILEEVKKHATDHEARHGRFPKTLIFAANDLPHTSHSDQLVDLARDVFGRGDSFVQKITGRVDRPLQRIREFRNRQLPGVVVTVDMLSTGVDIPDLEFIVFLRPVKSRILFEQMLGRGTRKGEKFPDKSHFVVFDCFDGTLFEYFRQATAITEEEPIPPTRTLHEIVEDIWANRDRDYNIRCLTKRLLRVEKEMHGDARKDFAVFLPEGDIATFAKNLYGTLKNNFTGTMTLLRNADFQRLLLEYKRKSKTFLVSHTTQDLVSSEWLIRGLDGKEYKPEDYLVAFSEYVRSHETDVQAISVLLKHPQDWNPEVLKGLRDKLAATPQRFTVENLQRAHELKHKKPLADIISMVKHAANQQNPLLNAAERVERAFKGIIASDSFTPEQLKWLERIRTHLQENLSIDEEDFESQPVFADFGGWGNASKVFRGRLPVLIKEINGAIAA